MRYDSLKNPFHWRMNLWSARRTTDLQETQAKSVPCHVVKTEKDFVYVQFETNNSIFTMPTVKMTQGYSRFGREPTQKGDKGFAAAGGYYMGGNTAYAGGNTSFYPRGNLSTLSFQPLANLNAPKRDYDQHHETGGPNGWMMRTMEAQQQSAGPGQSGGSGSPSSGSSSTTITRAQKQVMQRRHFMEIQVITTANGSSSSSGNGSSSSSGGQGSQQQQSNTQYSFDKNDLCTIQSKDTNHNFTVDSKNKKMTLNVPTNENIYVGGDGKTGQYARIMTEKGPVINAQGRIK
jgi:hypothetical protein